MSVNAHARMFVPGSNLSHFSSARRIVSWTRSSALWLSPRRVRAKARRFRVTATRSARKTGSAPAVDPAPRTGLVDWNGAVSEAGGGGADETGAKSQD